MAIRTVGVKFDKTTTYSFLTDIEGLQEEDYVVCDTSRGLALGKVCKQDDCDTEKSSKFIVCKIDLTAHNFRMEKLKQLKELKDKMTTRRKKLEDLEVFELLASKDDEMKNLLEQYKHISQS